MCLILRDCISYRGTYIRQHGDLLGMTHNTNKESYRLCGLGQECGGILVIVLCLGLFIYSSVIVTLVVDLSSNKTQPFKRSRRR